VVSEGASKFRGQARFGEEAGEAEGNLPPTSTCDMGGPRSEATSWRPVREQAASYSIDVASPRYTYRNY
jgi:hypothetical protein